LDYGKNKRNEKVISKIGSKVKVLVIPTDEEKGIIAEVGKLR